MNRQVFVVVCLAIVLTGAFVLFSLTRPQPGPSVPASPVEQPAPRIEQPSTEPPAAKEERKPSPPEPTSRTARREPGPPTTAPPPPAAGPVTVAPEAGILHIDSDIPGAQVFIDRVFIGATPVTAPNVKPGTHRLNVSAEGYDGVAETLDVVPGPRDVLIKLKDVRLDATIAVVHSHRVGSCRGQLTATPQGLRYQTTDKDDGFSVPLQDLETFQVDYLEKRLRVKLQKGKAYVFTDPEGNADRLFVFHRDVDKARERLKKGDPPAGR